MSQKAKKKNGKYFICHNCGFNCSTGGELFYLKDELWWKIMGRRTVGGILCIDCCEKKLGRKLNRNDFTECYINRVNYGNKSARLLNRLRPVQQVKEKIS